MDVKLKSTSIGNASGISANVGGGLVSVGIANASASVFTTGTVTLDTGVRITATTRDVSIESSTTQKVDVLSDTNGGGLVATADANSLATLNFDSQVTVGDNSVITAGRDLLVQATTAVDAAATADADAAGLGAGGTGNAEILIGGISARTRAMIGDVDLMAAEDVNVVAKVERLKARSEALLNVGGFTGGGNTTGRVTVRGGTGDEVTEVSIGKNATLTGEKITLDSRHQNVDLSTLADADFDGVFGGTEATSETDYQSMSKVVVADGAELVTGNLNLNARQEVARYDRDARATLGKETESGEFNARRLIDFNGDMVLYSTTAPTLDIGQDGTVVTATGVTVNGGRGVGYVIPAGTTASVDSITGTFSGATVKFLTNDPGKQDDKEAPESQITGSTGTAQVLDVLREVTITNQSDRDIDIYGITSANNAKPDVTLDAKKVNLNFAIVGVSASGDTAININNNSSLLTIKGVIENPLGTTVVHSAGGIAGSSTGMVRGKSVELTADNGYIGTPTQRVNVELIRTGPPTSLDVSAPNAVWLQLAGRLREGPPRLPCSTAIRLWAAAWMCCSSRALSRPNRSTGNARGLKVRTIENSGDTTKDYFFKYRPDPDGQTNPLETSGSSPTRTRRS